MNYVTYVVKKKKKKKRRTKGERSGSVNTKVKSTAIGEVPSFYTVFSLVLSSKVLLCSTTPNEK